MPADEPGPLPHGLLDRLASRPDAGGSPADAGPLAVRPRAGASRPDASLLAADLAVLQDSGYLKLALPARFGGAGLDVYDTEPLPLGDSLRLLPNTVLTPHLGYVTDETYQVFYREAVEDIAAFINGSTIRVLNG